MGCRGGFDRHHEFYLLEAIKSIMTSPARETVARKGNESEANFGELGPGCRELPPSRERLTLHGREKTSLTVHTNQ